MNNQSLNVTMLSKDDRYGGASNAAFGLYSGLKETDVNVQMVVRNKRCLDKNIHRENDVQVKKDFEGSMKPYLEDRPEGLPPFSNIRTHVPLIDNEAVQEADILNLHWVSRFLDYSNFLEKFSGIPVVITLADMNWLTGGCHYAMGCEGFKNKCGNCPQLGSSKENDLSRKIWRLKKEALGKVSNLQVVAPSRWMAEKARESSLFSNTPVEVIPYGISMDNFRPRKIPRKSFFDIPESHQVILFGATNFRNERKGPQDLIKALEAVKKNHKKISLVCFGEFKDAKPFEALDLNFFPVGRIYEPKLLSHIYSLSDVFVFPSLAESFGLVQTEAMACGTPVIAYDNGGSQEALKGYEQNLVEKGNHQALAQKIIEKLEEKNLKSKKKMEERRNYVKNNFSNRIQAEKYLELFKNMTLGEQ